VQAGENSLDAVCREVREETGITVTTGDFIDWKFSNRFEIAPQWRYRFIDGTTHNTENLFSLCVPAGVPVSVNPREHSGWRWLPWREAARACFSWSNRDAIYLLAQEVLSGRLSPVPARHCGQ